MDWSTLPDLAAVVLLTLAFGSVARRGLTRESRLWLIGWITIDLHFAAFLFDTAPGGWGTLASTVGLDALAWAGILFMWACVPYRERPSSRWMLVSLLVCNTLYISLVSTVPHLVWALTAAAVLLGVAPAAIAATGVRRGFMHPLRWTVVLLNAGLMVFLLAIQQRPGNGTDLAFDGVIFTIYIGCCIHFWYAFRRATAGSFVTIAGFAAWASVFVVAPLMEAYWPKVQVQSEVWNLPKYVVAVGMILLLLVDLDHFKEVNDSVGHHVGDLLLQQVSRLFLGRVRRSDTVARTGGDEFCIILEEPTSRTEAQVVGESLIRLLEEPLQVEGHTVAVGASVGIAVYPEDAETAERLRIAADRSMYADKNVSRSRMAEQAPD